MSISGNGEILGDPKHIHADAALVARAIREGWPIRPETRAKILQRVDDMLELEGITPSELNQVASIVLNADKRNYDRDVQADKERRLEEGKPTEIQDGKTEVTIRFVRPDQGGHDAQ